MQEQLLIQKILHRKLGELKSKNSSYSLRAFSKRIGVSPATASLLLNGRRVISRKLALKVCDALLLDPIERMEVLKHFPEKKRALQTAAQDSVGADALKLTADHFKMMSDWYYLGILSLLKLEGFQNDPQWIADRLGITPTEVIAAIERMKRLEILYEDPNGRLMRRASKFRTTDDVTNLSIRRAHFESLELAKASLERDAVELRDFTSVTMAIYPEKIPEAKVLIRKFLSEIDALLESGDGLPKEVYRVCVQLFPLTKVKKEK